MDRGFENLLWFMGVVEDNVDPQLLGRVRVRAFGIHPTDTEKVPTEDLPWAYVISGTYSNAYKPPELNEWVFGFFIDGKSAQQPMLLGTLLGMPTMPPAAQGDSNGGFTVMGDGSTMRKLFRPDMPRLATGEELHMTPVLAKNATGGQRVKTSNGRGWDTPKSAYAAQYPHNYVHETPSGHVFEMDDTPGNERVHLYHRSGSHIEINSNGQTTIKSAGSMFVVVENNGYVRILGDANLTVEGKANVLVENDCDLQVDGNLTQRVFGDYSLEVSGRYDVNVGETIRMRGAGVTIESSTDNVDIIAKNNMFLEAGANVNIKADGNIKQSASQVHINSDDPTFQADDASPTEMDEPGKRKTVAYKGLSDPMDMGIASDDGDETAMDETDPEADPFPGKTQDDLVVDPEIEQHRPMLDMIGQYEGTDAGRGYNETLAYGALTGGPVNLTDMTVDEVIALQGDMLNHPRNRWNSSAVGRYQITRQTLRDFMPRLGITGDMRFTPALQDRVAVAIMRSTGGNVARLRGRWAGLRRANFNAISNTYWDR